ncbi:ABHD6 [Branchiostoma lanceolatum]|uniref:acylglycerol lipase n=1 Tax=Branchiostoma lanceolatum TaxID=7740 RepID=A0A8K0AF03_BRALA|nr:ABHD6 [Branchiostoma lanceolatum]
MSAIPLLRLLVAGVSTMTLVPLVSLVFVYNTKPDIIIKAIRKAVIWRAGLTVKFVTVDGYRFAYGERGRPSETQPSILFLHGFSTSKDTWARFITALPRNLHIITLDLPGHGESDRNPNQDLSMEGQANTVHRFVDALGLDQKPFHLVGTSMGGGIAGLYAATYRKNIALLTLFCPFGVLTPVYSYTMKAFLEGRNMLVPKTMDDFREMMKINSYQYKIGKLKVPDKVFDVSGADILREGVPNCRLDILDDCGHVVTVERTQQAVAVFMNFREEVLNGYKK